eukprot:gene254-8695_t
MNLKEVQRFVYKGGRLKRPSGCPEDMTKRLHSLLPILHRDADNFFSGTLARCTGAPRDVGRLINELLTTDTDQFEADTASLSSAFSTPEVRNSLALESVEWGFGDGGGGADGGAGRGGGGRRK